MYKVYATLSDCTLPILTQTQYCIINTYQQADQLPTIKTTIIQGKIIEMSVNKSTLKRYNGPSSNQIQLQSDEEYQGVCSKQQISIQQRSVLFGVLVLVSCVCFVGLELYLLANGLKNVPSTETNIDGKQQQAGPVSQIKQQQISEMELKIDNSNPNSTTNWVIQALRKQMKAGKYYAIDQKQKHAQLPFCIIIDIDIHTNMNINITDDLQSQLSLILSSIQQQSYSNIKIIVNSSSTLQLSPWQSQLVTYLQLKSNQSQIYNALSQHCPCNSLLLFMNIPLKTKVLLKHINNQHQNFNIWLTYSVSPTSVNIIAFYMRVYELLAKNDFKRTNQAYLLNNNKEMITIGLLQLCAQHSKSIQTSTIAQESAQIAQYYSTSMTSQSLLHRQAYVAISRLSQDYQNTIIFDPFLKQKAMTKQPIPQLNLTLDHMLLSMALEQLIYLPSNHSVAQFQLEYYNKKYSIDRYSGVEKQVRFCLTILNHNNVQNQRYRKLLMSILMQNYTNYHIVFMDDFSTDDTIAAVKHYLANINTSININITYIRNTQRMFATYNILNSIYNYCQPEQIQMLLDGDDEVIGRYAFQLLNAGYHAHFEQYGIQPWLVYSNYKTNLYNFGRSRPILSQSQHLSKQGHRNFISYIGPIRTWKVKLIYNIPLQYHRIANYTKWLDTAYDDALQYCMLELATHNRSRYIPEILYEYNRKYGDNDDATPDRLQYRNRTYTNEILTRKPLISLTEQQFKSSARDREIIEILEKDRNVKYQQV